MGGRGSLGVFSDSDERLVNPPHLPRESAPSIALVLVTLFVAVAVCFGTVLVGIRVVEWWRS
jgi:hypothetical protein